MIANSKALSSFLFLLCLVVLNSCSTPPKTLRYCEMYAYLKEKPLPYSSFHESDYFLIILTDARHLDYTSSPSFFKTVAKHPDDGCKLGDVGHSWIYLRGIKNGEPVYLEGGYSGESGRLQARYLDGVMNNIDYGYANPSLEQMQHPRVELNPAKYLWDIQHDGFFQWGSGYHCPTYAAKIDLSAEQFETIWSFINDFPYLEYSITNNQCASFATQVALLGGLELDCKVTIPIEPVVRIGGKEFLFWTDPAYAYLEVSSPDMVERSLMQAVRDGRAEYALDWYHQHYPEPWSIKATKWRKNVTKFPKRFARYVLMRTCTTAY